MHVNLYLGGSAAVNAIGHHFGRRPYDNNAGNLQWLAFLTAGEGLHNNHHAAPTSAKLAHRWFEIDPGLVGDPCAHVVPARPGAPQGHPAHPRRGEGLAMTVLLARSPLRATQVHDASSSGRAPWRPSAAANRSTWVE